MVNTALYVTLFCSEWKRSVDRVRLMVLRAPTPTRSQRSLEHRYSQLFLTSPRMREYKLVSLELRVDDSVLLFNCSRKDRIRDGQIDGKRKREKERQKKIDSRDSFEKVLKPVLLTLVLVFHFSIRLCPRANKDDWEIILLLRKVCSSNIII